MKEVQVQTAFFIITCAFIMVSLTSSIILRIIQRGKSIIGKIALQNMLFCQVGSLFVMCFDLLPQLILRLTSMDYEDFEKYRTVFVWIYVPSYYAANICVWQYLNQAIFIGSSHLISTVPFSKKWNPKLTQYYWLKFHIIFLSLIMVDCVMFTIAEACVIQIFETISYVFLSIYIIIVCILTIKAAIAFRKYIIDEKIKLSNTNLLSTLNIIWVVSNTISYGIGTLINVILILLADDDEILEMTIASIIPVIQSQWIIVCIGFMIQSVVIFILSFVYFFQNQEMLARMNYV